MARCHLAMEGSLCFFLCYLIQRYCKTLNWRIDNVHEHTAKNRDRRDDGNSSHFAFREVLPFYDASEKHQFLLEFLDKSLEAPGRSGDIVPFLEICNRDFSGQFRQCSFYPLGFKSFCKKCFLHNRIPHGVFLQLGAKRVDLRYRQSFETYKDNRCRFLENSRDFRKNFSFFLFCNGHLKFRYERSELRNVRPSTFRERCWVNKM